MKALLHRFTGWENVPKRSSDNFNKKTILERKNFPVASKGNKKYNSCRFFLKYIL